VLQFIKDRHSVRRFKSQDIPDEKLTAILDAARWAPSAGNIQPWFFYVVKGREERETLASFALNQIFIARAPVSIVVCAETGRSAGVYGSRGSNLYCIQDTAAATQNILLAANALGLGSCWVGAFDEERVHNFLKMPDQRRPVAIIPLGYPEKTTGRQAVRREIEEITQFT